MEFPPLIDMNSWPRRMGCFQARSWSCSTEQRPLLFPVICFIILTSWYVSPSDCKKKKKERKKLSHLDVRTEFLYLLFSWQVNFNEPLSMLQRLTEDLEYHELLDRAAKCENSLEQLCYVAAFTVSSYSTTVFRTSKPFNPLLGETFELDRLEENGYRSLCEQVKEPQDCDTSPFWRKGWFLWLIPLGVNVCRNSRPRHPKLPSFPSGLQHWRPWYSSTAMGVKMSSVNLGCLSPVNRQYLFFSFLPFNLNHWFLQGESSSPCGCTPRWVQKWLDVASGNQNHQQVPRQIPLHYAAW